MTMTTCNSPAHTFTTQRPPVFRGVLRLIVKIIATQDQRRALRTLDSAALNDLGLSYADAKREANRPFWDVPATWRR
ncbi:DUF1127 domain-containing protein [Profundibacter sp.]